MMLRPPGVEIRCLRIDGPTADVGAAAMLLGRYRAFVATPAGPGFRMPRLDAEIAGLPASCSGAGTRLLLAFVDGEPAGCISLRQSGPISELKRMWVENPARNRGVGQALVEEAIDYARCDGAVAIHLDTEPERMPAAAQLYRRLGFRSIPPPAGAEPGLEFLRLDLGGAVG